MTQNRIRALREARGWSQTTLGERIGTSKFSVSRLEAGATRLDLETAKKVADALEVSVAEVLGIEPAPAGRAGGFREDAEVYKAGLDDPFARLADASRNQSLYRITSDAVDEVGPRAGDVALVDLSHEAVEKVRPMAIVIAQRYLDPIAGNGHEQQIVLGRQRAVTLVRQFVPPGLLITNSRRQNEAPVNMATDDVAIKGVVVSWHRSMSSALRS